MGAFHIKATSEPFLSQVLIEPGAAPSPQAEVKLWPKLRRPKLVAAALLVTGVTIAISSAVYWREHLASSVVTPEPFAYFEIKAIGPDGRAVAGAVVTSAGSEVGVTDSFGEWRRFIRVKLGGSLPLQLTKVQGGEAIAATRNVGIPTTLPSSGGLSIKGRIELSRVAATAIGKVKKSAAKAAVNR